jgi:hypothetical protein
VARPSWPNANLTRLQTDLALGLSVRQIAANRAFNYSTAKKKARKLGLLTQHAKKMQATQDRKNA